jgi:hypothetical protein
MAIDCFIIQTLLYYLLLVVVCWLAHIYPMVVVWAFLIRRIIKTLIKAHGWDVVAMQRRRQELAGGYSHWPNFFFKAYKNRSKPPIIFSQHRKPQTNAYI